MAEENLIVRGAREHNLQNVDVEIPRDKLTVITGLSGSGKSSLAFDTIYAEGQRRYVESLSAYARQFLGMMEKPDVDSIEGLSPAISIEQKTAGRNPRSTVGTVTEVYDYLRLLWARAGTPHCPSCGKPVERQSATQIVERLMSLPAGTLAGSPGPRRPRPQGRVPRPVRGDAPQGLYPRPHRRRRPPAGGAAGPGPPRQPRHQHLRGAQGGGGRRQPLAHRRRGGDGAAQRRRRGADRRAHAGRARSAAGAVQRALRLRGVRHQHPRAGAPAVLLQLPVRRLPRVRRPGDAQGAQPRAGAGGPLALHPGRRGPSLGRAPRPPARDDPRGAGVRAGLRPQHALGGAGGRHPRRADVRHGQPPNGKAAAASRRRQGR